MREVSEEANGLSELVIGAAIEVHRALGPGYLERTYEEALAFEFGLRGIPFSRQHPVEVSYKGHHCGDGALDFLVGGVLVVELKTVDQFAPSAPSAAPAISPAPAVTGQPASAAPASSSLIPGGALAPFAFFPATSLYARAAANSHARATPFRS